MGQGGARADWESSSDKLTIQGDGYKAVEGQVVKLRHVRPDRDRRYHVARSARSVRCQRDGELAAHDVADQ